ncbi:Protein-lysine N-methyltransferase efm4 [Elsinoe australis]|uniref:Protein-lysine N-methyltransferase EFM4 n=1 Tax=Elsinoe australis TaxID=40998 RepID=A0A2P7YDF9_9PEZI|nr:Protein-lysine N-methyltransferase efm4 [Elsinoe australis]
MNEALNTSELGSKSYWDEAYEREIRNHAEDADDEGTVWFDDTGAEEKVLELLNKHAEEGSLSEVDGDTYSASKFLDLGTGNGHMIFELREEGWQGDMVGVDYSETSVRLAQQIAAQRAESDASAEKNKAKNTTAFYKWDLLQDEPGAWLKDGFDVVLDKGTFDAISLSSETNAQGRRSHEGYREKVLPLIKPGGLFIITSCNWTRDEVLKWFEGADGQLSLVDEVDYPSFTFGGEKGQSVCTLAFKRKSD